MNRNKTFIEYTGWASNIVNLAWSKDGELAVPLDDQLELLIPRLKLSEPWHGQQEEYNWNRIRIHPNLFSVIESPLKDPLAFTWFSIGEEQAESHITATEWSAPGLAKNKKCALAVLTANHLLSIWASTGDPQAHKSWKRVLIVNNILKERAQGAAMYSPGISDEDVVVNIRKSQRIRSFSWGPCLEQLESSTGGLPEESAFPILKHYMVVSNDMGEIFILKINSPHQSIPLSESNWSADIVCARYPLHSVDSACGAFVSTLGLTRLPLNLCWSDWIDLKDDKRRFGLSTGHSLICYTVKSRLFTWHLRAPSGESEGFEFIGEPRSIDGDHAAPVRVFTNNENCTVRVLSVSGPKIRDTVLQFDQGVWRSRTSSSPRNEPWYPTSCIAMRNVPGAEFGRASAINYLSYGIEAEAALEPQTQGKSSASLSSDIWMQDLHFHKSNFNSTHELNGNMFARIYGLITCPTGECHATLFSLHPCAKPQMSNLADQKTILNVSNEDTDPIAALKNQALSEARLHNATAEAMVQFTRRTIKQIRGRDPTFGESNMYKLLCKVLSGKKRRSVPIQLTNPPTSLIELIRHLRTQINWEEHLAEQIRWQSNQNSLQGQSSQGALRLLEHRVSQRLASLVLGVPEHFYQKTPLDSHILGLHRLCYNTSADVPQGVLQSNGSHHATPADENCTICGGAVPFEHVRWAVCVRGHHFSRCSLTFCIIDRPGISRACGICSRQYLIDTVLMKELFGRTFMDIAVPADAADQMDCSIMYATQTKPSLVHILLAAFETCVYCGGKFVG